jgi:magnesium chelatase family protein
MTEPTGDQQAVMVPAVAYTGAAAHMVRIRAVRTADQQSTTLTGLPDEVAWTTRDRIRAAIVNAGLRWPTESIALDVFPAALMAADSGIDAALAVALLAATGQVPVDALRDAVFAAELGLDGRLRTPRALPERLAVAAGAGYRLALLPATSLDLAATVPGIRAWPAHHLRELVDELHAAADGGEGWPSPGVPIGDLADLPAEHRHARRVLEVAAAGGHHLALIGPATAATTMLAHRLPGLLPDLDDRTGRQVADLYRMAGLLPPHVRALRRPPWQAPHHTTTTAALIGSPRKPGAISLAHAGVLFLDQAPEFNGRSIEALSQPLSTCQVVLVGGTRAVEYPAGAQLLVASRDCPCWEPDGCICTPARRRRYLRRLQPLLARVDIRASMPPMPLPGASPGESTAVVAARVARARAAAAARWGQQRVTSNHELPTEALRHSLNRFGLVDLGPLRAQLDAGSVTARGASHILRLAWTIADLTGRDRPDHDDLAEAIALHTGSNSA